MVPVFDFAEFSNIIKSVAQKVLGFGLLYAVKIFTWTFYIASFTLAVSIMVKLYNSFHTFKDGFEGFVTNNQILGIAKASGIVDAFIDLFSTFMLFLAPYIAYQASLLARRIVAKIDKDASDAAFLLGK